MPTGVVLRDPRAVLFAAADRVVIRAGASALTSRAVTEEAGVAKGVLHRHFADFPDFLVELVRDKVARLEEQASQLQASAGQGTVVSNVSAALVSTFTAPTLGLISIVASTDALRTRLCHGTSTGLPILAETTQALASYLRAEQACGRLTPGADPDSLAFTLTGTGHLLFAGQLGAVPDTTAVDDVVASILVGAQPGART